MIPERIKNGGDDEVCCLFWLFLRQSGATVVLPTVGGAITPLITMVATITMVAITIIGARDGGTVIAGGARRINDLRLWEPQKYSPDYDITRRSGTPVRMSQNSQRRALFFSWFQLSNALMISAPP